MKSRRNKSKGTKKVNKVAGRKGAKVSIRQFIINHISLSLDALCVKVRKAGYWAGYDDASFRNAVRRYRYHIEWQLKQAKGSTSKATSKKTKKTKKTKATAKKATTKKTKATAKKAKRTKRQHAVAVSDDDEF